MAAWRDIKAKQKTAVHRTFQVPAVYLTHDEGLPVRIMVRIHRKPTVDRLTFADFSDAAAGYVAEDIVVFDLAEIAKPSPDAFLIVSREEAYKLGAAKPRQDGYMHVSVNEMAPKMIDDLLYRAKADPLDPVWQGIIE